ncbi:MULTISPECIES: hypothetical protein [Nocardia]|uniref:hypothetical protein n=1 Tax=Nocardia TaxID=1817 RepID=UPI001C4E2F25|nr:MULTISPECIES: hypothetical protein [unclassified Nocardia]WKG08777.1 hypothetical protein QX204_27650 [Nocardia sp. PE-7]
MVLSAKVNTTRARIPTPPADGSMSVSANFNTAARARLVRRARRPAAPSRRSLLIWATSACRGRFGGTTTRNATALPLARVVSKFALTIGRPRSRSGVRVRARVVSVFALLANCMPLREMPMMDHLRVVGIGEFSQHLC